MQQEQTAPTGNPVEPALEQQTEPQQQEATNPLLDREPQSNEQAPVQQQEEAPESVEEKPAPTSLSELIEHEFEGDPAANMVYRSLERMLGDADTERAFLKAIEEDDPRFIDTAYLQEVCGENTPEIVRMAEYLFGYADRMQQQLQTQLYANVPGGYEGAQLAAKHFKATATPEQQEIVRALLDSGDMRLMQHGIQQIMQSAQGTVPQHRPGITGMAQGVQPMTRAEFGKAVLANPNMSTAEYNKLRERLAAGLN